MIRDCTVGDASTVNASQLNESTVGCRTNVGPFAYVRPGCTVGDDIKVGDFVEFGGLLGRAPVIPVHPFSSEAFIARGGRIPAPLHSLRN